MDTSVELTFPMDSPNKETTEPDEYCLWEPEEASTTGPCRTPNISESETGDISEECSSINNGGSTAEVTEESAADGGSSTGCIRISPPESLRMWPDGRFGGGSGAFRRRARTVESSFPDDLRSRPRRWLDKRRGKDAADGVNGEDVAPRAEKLPVSTAMTRTGIGGGRKSFGDGGDYLSPRGMNFKRYREEYCDYDLSSSAPSAPSDISATSHQPPQTTNLRRYTVAKTYFPSRSSSSFSFRGSGKNLNNIKSSTSCYERLSTSISKSINSNSMGEIACTKSCETMNKESGNHTLSRIKKSIGKFVNRSRSRASDTETPVSPQTNHKDDDSSWQTCPYVIQQVADSKEKGLPIIPMPLCNFTRLPKIQTPPEDPPKSTKKCSPLFDRLGFESRKKSSDSDKTSTRNHSECSTYSFTASDTSCTLLSDCPCVRCTLQSTSVENSLYILLDQTPSDEGELFSFERTKSDAAFISRPSILKTSPDKKIQRRETVSEGCSDSMRSYKITPPPSHRSEFVGPSLINYNVREKRFSAVTAAPVKSEAEIKNNDGYLVMELGAKDKVPPVDPEATTSAAAASNQYVVMNISAPTADHSTAKTVAAAKANPGQNEYLLMACQPSSGATISKPGGASAEGPPVIIRSMDGSDVDEYMQMDGDTGNKDRTELANEYMSMAPVHNVPKNIEQHEGVIDHDKSSNIKVDGCDNHDYILAFAPHESKNSTPSEEQKLPTNQSYGLLYTCDNDKGTPKDYLNTKEKASPSTSSVYSRPFSTFKLPFTKQLSIPKGSSSKSGASSSSSNLTTPTSPDSPMSAVDPMRLSVITSSTSPTASTSSSTHRNSVSQKLSPITKRLSSIKLKPSSSRQQQNQQDRLSQSSAGQGVAQQTASSSSHNSSGAGNEVDPNKGCYLDIGGGVLQDVTVLQEVLQDPRIAGPYTPVSGVIRKVSFNANLPVKAQDPGGGQTSNHEDKANYMSCGPSSGTANMLRSKSLTDDQVMVLKGKLNYFLNVAQENREYRRHRKANKNKEDYVMVNFPASTPQNIKSKTEPDKKTYLSLSN